MTPNADTGRVPQPALRMCFFVGFRLPPPWFVPVEAPACCATVLIPAEAGAPFPALVCDDLAGHEGNHRMVTNNEQGHVIEWNSADLDTFLSLSPNDSSRTG